MLRVENLRADGFEAAFRGMRNPLNSWNKSDSFFDIIDLDESYNFWEIASYWADSKLKSDGLSREERAELWEELREEYADWLQEQGEIKINRASAEVAFVGPSDMNLAQRLISAGPEHAKFLRQINTSFDITAPLYW